MKKINEGDSIATAPHKMEQDAGSIFKRTEIIGRGKFGIVYKGYHTKTKQVYAIKVLNLDSDEDEVEDVQREIQFLSSMKQVPNITHYYGSYLKDTSLWIIIEYCAGGSLRTLLRPGKIDEKYIGVIMRELLIALKYIHKDNVIHRDIKAANVLITNEGQVKLCDFGVAAQLNQSKSRRQTMAGTPYWMAPEVIMEGVYYDTKVDIWSLGITTYEIATGNPPYCEVEALRAMQLITKSKPPRLEGRNYSSLLKEFIALCLDEDPKERLSADDLLKTKFIKTHRTTSSTLLKQLISRYLLFRDNNKSTRESIFLADDDSKINEKKHEKAVESDDTSSVETTAGDVEVDVKWDFDSLSSSDYIMENDINLEEIPEGCTHDWTSTQSEAFNYAYPEEDQFYYYPTNNNTSKVYQGTTIGKTQPSTMLHNSTLNAPSSHNNTTSNFTSKVMKSVRTNPTAGTTSHSNTTSTSKKTEARVPKKLLELFEGNEVINEEEVVESDLSRINRNISHLHMGSLPEDSATQSTTELSAARPHVNLINSNAYHSQSTPALPVLQTKFSKSTKGPTSAVTMAPTPIEIEIPEELPTSTISNQPSTEAIAASQTKPRSSTVSTSGPVPYQKAPGISRRLTVGTTAGIRENSNNTPVNRGTDEQMRNASGSVNVDNSNASLMAAAGVTTLGNTWNNKHPLRSPSPSKLYTNNGNSPTKRPGNSPNGSIAPPPSMKAIGQTGDKKEPLLQHLNTTSLANNESTNTIPDKETSRVNRDFKRNNPNLKLHMPLPTTMVTHKLLETPASITATAITNNNVGSENINQFGFNTSSASNMPVSMTPINEKHLEWGTKPKRGHSISNRKNSQNSDPIVTPSVFGQTTATTTANTMQAPSPMNIGPTSSSSINVASILPNGSAITANPPATSSQPSLGNNSTSSAVGTINTGGITGPVAATSAPGGTNVPALMQPPPSSINMDIFLDVDASPSESHQWVDKKPRVLQELEALLQMYEEALPVVENALQKQLLSNELPIGEH